MLNIFNQPANDNLNLGPNYYGNANIIFTPQDLDDSVEELSIDTFGFKPASSLITKESCLTLFVKEYNRTITSDRFRLSDANLLEICSSLFRTHRGSLAQRRDLAILRDQDTILDLYVSRLRWCVCIKKSSSDISDEMQVHYFMKQHTERTNVEFLYSIVNPMVVTHSDAHKAIQMFDVLRKIYVDIEKEHPGDRPTSLTALKYTALQDFIKALIDELESASWSVSRCDCLFEMLSLLAFEACMALEGVELYKRRFDDDYIQDLENVYQARLLTMSLREAVYKSKYGHPSIVNALRRFYAPEA